MCMWASELDRGVMEEGGLVWWITLSFIGCVAYLGNTRHQYALWEENKAEAVGCFGQCSTGKPWVLPSMWMLLWHVPQGVWGVDFASKCPRSETLAKKQLRLYLWLNMTLLIPRAKFHDVLSLLSVLKIVILMLALNSRKKTTEALFVIEYDPADTTSKISWCVEPS